MFLSCKKTQNRIEKRKKIRANIPAAEERDVFQDKPTRCHRLDGSQPALLGAEAVVFGHFDVHLNDDRQS